MAQVALKRDIEAYQKALNQYQQAATKHNRTLDAYRSSFIQDEQGNMRVFYGQASRGGYVLDGGDGTILPYGSYEGVRMGYGYAVRPNTLSHIKPPPDFTKTPPENDPSRGMSLAQFKKLDQPTLTDIERNQPSGLINSSFKGY